MKSNFTRAFVLVTICALFGNTANAQFKDKFFFSNGFSIYTDYVFGMKEGGYTDPYGNVYEGESIFAASIFTYTPNFRYNLTEFDENSSLSLNVPLGIGLMTSTAGFGSIELPLYIAYNTGNISTYSSDKNKGFTIGIGIEYFNMALFKSDDWDIDGAPDITSWVSPCVNVGFRYWNKRNIAREFNLKCGFGSNTTETYTEPVTGTSYDIDYGSPFTLKLTWFRYLNY